MTVFSRTGLIGILLVLLTAGCEEAVDARVETNLGVSAYGFFNADSDTQAVRIYTIDPTLELTGSEPLDVHVTSTDLTTGEMVVWQDSVVQFFGGRVGHVYWSAFRAEHEHRYRFEAERPGKVTAVAEATVPAFTEPMFRSDIASGYPRQGVAWNPAPRINGVRAIYRFLDFRDVSISYQGQQRRLDGGWIIEVDVRRDADRIRSIMRTELGSSFAATLLSIDVRAVVSNEEWFPSGEGVYDADLLVEPGTFSNVTNGFGFVGAGFRTALSWVPPDEVVRLMGFRPAPE